MTHYHSYLIRINDGFRLPSHVAEFFGAVQAQFPCVRIELDPTRSMQPGVEITGPDLDPAVVRSMEQVIDEWIEGYLEDLYRTDSNAVSEAAFNAFFGHDPVPTIKKPEDIELAPEGTEARNKWLNTAMNSWENGYINAAFGNDQQAYYKLKVKGVLQAWLDGFNHGLDRREEIEAQRKGVAK